MGVTPHLGFPRIAYEVKFLSGNPGLSACPETNTDDTLPRGSRVVRAFLSALDNPVTDVPCWRRDFTEARAFRRTTWL